MTTTTSITFTIDRSERDQVAVIRQIVLYAALCLQPDDDGHCDAETAITMLEGAVDMLRELGATNKGEV